MANRTNSPIALLLPIPLWLWTGATIVLDYLGRATVIGDLAKSDTVSAQAVAWLLSTPWWMPGALAALVTGVWLLTMLRLLRSQTSTPLQITPPLLVATPLPQPAKAGTGGSGAINGNYGTIVGGKGGDVGVNGNGTPGDGGSGTGVGDHLYIQGGAGGNMGTFDGRGGKATAPWPQAASGPLQSWGVGRGGPGGNLPEYERRVSLLIAIRSDYMTAMPDTRPFILAGIDQIAPDWINARLASLGETWQVGLTSEGYLLPPL